MCSSDLALTLCVILALSIRKGVAVAKLYAGRGRDLRFVCALLRHYLPGGKWRILRSPCLLADHRGAPPRADLIVLGGGGVLILTVDDRPGHFSTPATGDWTHWQEGEMEKVPNRFTEGRQYISVVNGLLVRAGISCPVMNIIVLSDEIYAELTYGRRHVSIASLPGMWERTILVSGFSKAYAMTGWRLGYICAPAPLTRQMLKIHQYAIMCAPTTAQLAAIEAVKNGDGDVAMMVDEYNRRRRYIYNGFKSIGIDCFEPEGAFYIYPEIGSFGLSSEEFCERLLHEHHCAIVPGTAFGQSGEGFARVSYAYSIKHITQALDRIEAFTKKLRG